MKAVLFEEGDADFLPPLLKKGWFVVASAGDATPPWRQRDGLCRGGEERKGGRCGEQPTDIKRWVSFKIS